MIQPIIRIASFSKNTPFGIIIKDKAICDSFISLFELAWLGAKEKEIN